MLARSILLSTLALIISPTPPGLQSDTAREGLKGNVREVRYYTESMPSGNRTLEFVLEYDRTGALTRQTWYRDANRPSISKFTSDSSDTVTITEIGKDGQALAARQTCCWKKRTRDAQGRVVEESHLDVDGKPIFRTRSQYDEQGRIVRESTVSKYGEEYAITTYEFDEAGQRVKTWRDGHIVEIIGKYKFDKQGNWIQREVASPDGNAPHPKGEPPPLTSLTIEFQEIDYYQERPK
ncbi:MAG: hypothetical protein IT175_05120 [Acidobacteria bacterium]|nr:hypothetical protein [Acidobacteriota bacterium]